MPVDTPNEYSAWVIDDSEFGYKVRESLEGAFGAFGHFLEKETTAIDLYAALMQPPSPFQVEILEGAELVEAIDPQIPEGAIT